MESSFIDSFEGLDFNTFLIREAGMIVCNKTEVCLNISAWYMIIFEFVTSSFKVCFILNNACIDFCIALLCFKWLQSLCPLVTNNRACAFSKQSIFIWRNPYFHINFHIVQFGWMWCACYIELAYYCKSFSVQLKENVRREEVK